MTITFNLKYEYWVSNGKLMEYLTTVYFVHFYGNLISVVSDRIYKKISN